MDFFLRHKNKVFIIAIIICMVSIALTATYRTKPSLIENWLAKIIIPAQKYITSAGRFIVEKVSFITNVNEIEQENNRLKSELEYLKTENSRLLRVEQDNIKLRELLGTAQKYPDYPKIGAEIIAKDTGNWYDSFIIDKGSNHGIQKNMVVMASGGLVGRIIESGKNYSKVKSLIDDTFSVSAKSIRTDDIGFVKGDQKLMSEGLCRMEHIDINAQIMEGDEIVTSNLGEIYPPGLTIGVVKQVEIDSNGLTKYAIIKPAVDFKRLETIYIINQTFPSIEQILEEK